MAYWVIYRREREDGRDEFDGEFFEEWIEAYVHCKVQRADRGRTAEVVEAHECERPDCDAIPEWGLELCFRCRNA